MTEFIEQLPRSAVLTIIIICGAIVHSTSQLKVARDKGLKFTWRDFVILIPMSMFSGWMFSVLALWLLPDGSDNFVSICAGLGSFLGIAGLNSIGNIFLELIEQRFKTKKL